LANHGPEPFARTYRWTFHDPAAPASCAAALTEVLAALATTCQRAGRHVIGHIKALAALPSGGFIRGSAVSTRQAPDVELHEPATMPLTGIDVTLNVLVVGMDPVSCERQVRDALDAAAVRYGFEYSPVESS